MASLMMGAWFFATAGGNFVAGKIGEATGGEGGEMTKEADTGDLHQDRLDRDRGQPRGPGAEPLVKRWMHIDTLEDRQRRRRPGRTGRGRRAADRRHAPSVRAQ